MRYRIVPAATLAVCLLSAENASPNVIVDGTLDDWGVSFTDDRANYGAMKDHGSATVDGRSFRYHVEDQSDSAEFGGRLGPNHGGQNYDAEFLGAGFDGANLVIAILTGQRPDNIFSQFSPGDVRIQTAAKEWFGVEIGGGAGGSDRASGQFTEGDAGSTYDVDSQGFTTDHSSHEAPLSDQLAGSVWASPTSWTADPIDDSGTSIDPQLTSGTYVGLSDYMYRWNADSNHAVMEIAIDRSMFGDANITGIEWAPGCGNDIVGVDIGPVENRSVPEPASLALLALGTISTLIGRIRRMMWRKFATTD